MKILAAVTLVAGCKKHDGAAPSAKAEKGPGIAECDSYLKAMEKFTRCDKAASAEQCKKAMSDLTEGAKFRNCRWSRSSPSGARRRS